ncbi:MAG: hypothetical protein K2M76_03150, partial [Muribaculaceae bacterium]|nr:hypothetical protein [Muribaculaceae bacterium]
PQYYGSTLCTFNLGTNLQEGSYIIRPAFIYEGHPEPTPMMTGAGAGYISMHVTDGKAYFTRNKPTDIVASNFLTWSPIYAKNNFGLCYTISNIGDGDFYERVKCLIGTIQDNKFTVNQVAFAKPVHLACQSKKQFYSNMSTGSLEPGNYHMLLVAGYNDIAISDTIPITVFPTPVNNDLVLSGRGVRITGGNTNVNPDQFEMQVSVMSMNNYNGKLKLQLFDPQQYTDSASFISAPVSIPAKQTATIKISCSYPSANADATYDAYIYFYDADNKLRQLSSTTIRFAPTSGIGSIKTDNTDSNLPLEYYDITGRRLPMEPNHGIYIRRQGHNSNKLIK